MEEFLNWIVPFYLRENHYYLTLAVGCTGGKHRSVAIAEMIKDRIEKMIEDIDEFERNVDVALSIVNAQTKITINF